LEKKSQELSAKIAACSSGDKVAYTQHGRAYNFYDPSNAQTMNAAFISAIYSQLITPPDPVEPFVSPPPPPSLHPYTSYHPSIDCQALCCPPPRENQRLWYDISGM